MKNLNRQRLNKIRGNIKSWYLCRCRYKKDEPPAPCCICTNDKKSCFKSIICSLFNFFGMVCNAAALIVIFAVAIALLFIPGHYEEEYKSELNRIQKNAATFKEKWEDKKVDIFLQFGDQFAKDEAKRLRECIKNPGADEAKGILTKYQETINSIDGAHALRSQKPEEKKACDKTAAPVKKASAPAKKASVPVCPTLAPVSTASEPVNTTSSPVSTASVPVNTTSTPVGTASEPANTTSTPVSAASAPTCTASAPARTASAPACTALAPVKTASKSVKTVSAPVCTTSTTVNTASVLVNTAPVPAPAASSSNTNAGYFDHVFQFITPEGVKKALFDETGGLHTAYKIFTTFLNLVLVSVVCILLYYLLSRSPIKSMLEKFYEIILEIIKKNDGATGAAAKTASVLVLAAGIVAVPAIIIYLSFQMNGTPPKAPETNGLKEYIAELRELKQEFAIELDIRTKQNAAVLNEWKTQLNVFRVIISNPDLKSAAADIKDAAKNLNETVTKMNTLGESIKISSANMIGGIEKVGKELLILGKRQEQVLSHIQELEKDFILPLSIQSAEHAEILKQAVTSEYEIPSKLGAALFGHGKLHLRRPF